MVKLITKKKQEKKNNHIARNTTHQRVSMHYSFKYNPLSFDDIYIMLTEIYTIIHLRNKQKIRSRHEIWNIISYKKEWKKMKRIFPSLPKDVKAVYVFIEDIEKSYSFIFIVQIMTKKNPNCNLPTKKQWQTYSGFFCKFSNIF